MLGITNVYTKNKKSKNKHYLKTLQMFKNIHVLFEHILSS